MEVTATGIPEVKLITPTRHQDIRGFLSEVFNQRNLQDGDITDNFVQENHSTCARPRQPSASMSAWS